MSDESDVLLVSAVRELASAIRDAGEQISDQLKEIDESLIAVMAKGADDGDIPSPTEVIQKVTDIGAKAVLRAIANWEKKLGSV